MSRPQEPHRPSFPFGNPFRMILPKGSYLSPRLLDLLNNFENTLAERLRKLKPKGTEDVLSCSWMKSVMECLCETHKDIKILITDLELPVCDWDDKWIDVYLDNSVKLLDICIALSSELSRLNQGHLLLQFVLRNLDPASPKQPERSRSSLESWRKHIGSENPKLLKSLTILESLTESINLPKVKNSAKGKVLMRAMYGVRVVTVFVCSVFVSGFRGSADKLIDLPVADSYLWSKAFTDLQSFVNGEIRNVLCGGRVAVLKELEAIDTIMKRLYPMIQNGVDPFEDGTYQTSVSDLGKSAEKLSEGLDLLTKEVDGFFQVVLSGRDALLGNLRVSPMKEADVQQQRVLRSF